VGAPGKRGESPKAAPPHACCFSASSLNAYLDAFLYLPGQHGMIALTGDAVVRSDLLSRGSPMRASAVSS
jgi:hypothetical protein